MRYDSSFRWIRRGALARLLYASMARWIAVDCVATDPGPGATKGIGGGASFSGPFAVGTDAGGLSVYDRMIFLLRRLL